MQGVNACNYGCERRGDLRILGVRPMRHAVHHKLINRRVKGCLHLGGVAGEFNNAAAFGCSGDLETVGTEPRGDGLNVLVGGTKLLAKLFGREPLVVIG